MPSARRKRLLARRSREGEMSSEDENINVMIGNENQTLRSQGHEQEIASENFPNSVSSVSNHEIRPNNVLRDISNDENRNRELIRAETGNVSNISENIRNLSEELNIRISDEMENIFDNLNSRIQGAIDNALNSRNVVQENAVPRAVLGQEDAVDTSVQNGISDMNRNERAVFGDTHLDRAQSCADLRPNGVNTDNLALRICTNDEGPYPLRACQSVLNISTGRDRYLNSAETNGGSQMGSNDAHNMAASRSHQQVTVSSHHMVTGEFDSQNSVPEFLTGRIRSQPDTRPQEYNRESSVPETTLDDSIQFQNGHNRPNNPNPFDRLADVIEGMNRPQPLLKPVNINTLVFDGKSDKFELFEDLFHTMLRMQPDPRPQEYNRESSVPETTLDDTIQFQNGHNRPNNPNPFDVNE